MENSSIQHLWDTILFTVFGNDKFNVFVYGTFTLTFLCFWVFGVFFIFVNITGKPKFLSMYKIRENVDTQPINRLDMIDLVLNTMMNMLITLPCLIVSFQIDQRFSSITNIDKLPTISSALIHIIFSLVAMEIVLYYFHRILHHPILYKWIHKKHHTCNAPIAISAVYCHPLEQIFLNLIPTVIGPFILSSHVVVLWIWLCGVIFTTLLLHSGYHLPFLPSPELHDFHHSKFKYNFGVTGVLDRLHGTDFLFRRSKESLRHRILFSLTPAKQCYP